MTGMDCRIERKRRGLTLADVAAKLEREDGGRGVSTMRLSRLERKDRLTEEEAGRITTAILDAQWQKAQERVKAGGVN